MLSIVRQLVSESALLSRFTLNRCQNAVLGLPPRRPLSSFNALFSRDCIERLSHEKGCLEEFNPQLYARLNETRLLGQLVFEYGTLLNYFQHWSTARVLDIGSGRSAFPYWMVSKGAKVATLELDDPAEGRQTRPTLLSRVSQRLLRRYQKGVTEYVGTMFALPFPSDHFDLVTSFSVIEHVDTSFPERTYVPYEKQREACARTLTEMVRVARPGGLIYLTSDCCDFTRATSDAWRAHYYYREGPLLSGAWPIHDVRSLFYDFFEQRGCKLIGPVSFDPALVNGDPRYETFRGKYWSAFSVLARKLPSSA